jgi:hypothetical protein
MSGGQIILAEGSSALSGSRWSVFTVGEICCNRRAFVFKLGGRCDKVAVGFCFSGSGPGQEDVLLKRLQVIFSRHTLQLYCVVCFQQIFGVIFRNQPVFVLHLVNSFLYACAVQWMAAARIFRCPRRSHRCGITVLTLQALLLDSTRFQASLEGHYPAQNSSLSALISSMHRVVL